MSSRLRGVPEMSLSDVAARVLAFIRAGYPEGVPPTDYYPLLALLRHRLTEDEVAMIAAQLVTFFMIWFWR